MRRFWVVLFFTFLFFSFSAFAQNKATIKMVFPFGGDQKGTFCPIPQRTVNGCCDPQNIYTKNAQPACCTLPNQKETVDGTEACCLPISANQTRWDQTAANPCGKYCTQPSSVLSAGTKSSCCKACLNHDDIRTYQSEDNVCGTCCSAIPAYCGFAGDRACDQTTGSAYCEHNPAKCGTGESLAGTSGEGGFSCCASCAGTKYNHTASVCGSCCSTASAVVTYSATTSCCSSLTTSQFRFSQTIANVCGTPVVCGVGATPNAEQTACTCDTGFEGTWKPDTGTGNGCIPKTCEGKMLYAGYNPANFTVSGNTITYTGTMAVSQDLDISECHLVVKNSALGNSLFINTNKTLTAQSIEVTNTGSSTGIGIGNTGTIIANTVTGAINGTGGDSIYNSGTITADTVTGTINGTGGHGIDNSGTITADTVTGTINGTGGHGIANAGTIEADMITGTMSGTGGQGIVNNGTITADTVAGTSYNIGISNDDNGTINASTVTGTGGNHGISNSRGAAITTTISVTGNGDVYGILNFTGGTITAPTVIGTSSSGTGIFNYETITATISVTGTSNRTSGNGIQNSGTITSPKVYYCTRWFGTKPANAVCKAGCTCTN